MESIKLVALSARGKALMSINVSPEETYNDIISNFMHKFQERIRKSNKEGLHFRTWRNDGYIIKEGD